MKKRWLLIPNIRNNLQLSRVKTSKIDDRKWGSINPIQPHLRSPICRQLSSWLNCKLFLIFGIIPILGILPLQAQDYWCLNNYISLRADYGYFRRGEIRDLRLIEDTSRIIKNKPKKLMDTDDLVDRLGWESAVSGNLTLHGTECSSLEGIYTYFYPWHAQSSRKADGTLQFPFKDPFIAFDYRDADVAVARYRSWLQNAELNYWWHVTPQRVNYFSFSWIVGIRGLFLRERMSLVFKKEADRSQYQIKTRNALYGPQLGAVLEINPTCRYSWMFMIKGAGFLNDAKNKVKIGDINDTVTLRDYSKKRWIDGWLLQGYGQFAYHFYSWLSVHFAYEGFILTGLALAPEQRDVHVKERRRIYTDGQVVIDGLFAGLTLSY